MQKNISLYAVHLDFQFSILPLAVLFSFCTPYKLNYEMNIAAVVITIMNDKN